MKEAVVFSISDQTQKVLFTYKNWKGEIKQHRASFGTIFYGSNEWHKTQWLVRAWDLDEDAYRTFALKDITDIRNIRKYK